MGDGMTHDIHELHVHGDFREMLDLSSQPDARGDFLLLTADVLGPQMPDGALDMLYEHAFSTFKQLDLPIDRVVYFFVGRLMYRGAPRYICAWSDCLPTARVELQRIVGITREMLHAPYRPLGAEEVRK